MPNKTYDAVIIGAGHNGLTCAGYLARAGLSVKIIERRDIVGGAAVTEEFHPGFRNSTCSHIVGALNDDVVRDLELNRFGMELIKREAGVISALSDGRHLIISDDDTQNDIEISKFSKKDAENYKLFSAELDEIAKLLRPLVENRPLNIGGGWPELWSALKTGNRFRKLKTESQETLLTFMTTSIGDYLDSWFESNEIKGLFAGGGLTGSMMHPYNSGSAYMLLHWHLGHTDGKQGAWYHAKGGMGNITQAMAKSAEAYGVDIETGITVKELIIDTDVKSQRTGKTTGVVLDDGRLIKAKIVIANCTPKILFTQLMDSKLLPASFEKRVQNYKYGSGTFRVNVALSELPDITSLKSLDDPAQIMKRSIIISPSIEYMEHAYRDARIRGFARKPSISMNIPTLLDDSLAPEGQHIASLLCQHFNAILPDNLDWDQIKDEATDAVLDTINAVAPNFRDTVLGIQALSPKDLENEYSLTGGDLFHGAMHLDQIYTLRPAAGYADYRMPVQNLYLCGAGAHPGGGVSGLPGKLSAQEILKDFTKKI